MVCCYLRHDTVVWTWQQGTKQIHCNKSVITSGLTKKKDFQVTVTSKCVRQQMGLGQRILSNVFWELYYMLKLMTSLSHT